MKKYILIILFLFLSNKLISSDCCFMKTCVTCAAKCDNTVGRSSKTFLAIRPQDSNTVRRLLNDYNNLTAFDDFCYSAITVEFQKSVNNNKISNWFLFNNKTCLTVGIPSRDKNFDINGRQIGLTTPNNRPGFIGAVCFNPKVENLIVDFDFTFNLDKCYKGLWARLICPIVYEKTTIGMKQIENNVSESVFFPKGFYTINCRSTREPFCDVIQALEGNIGFGDVPPMCCGKFSSSQITKSGIAGLHFDLGYDWVRDRCNYFGASIHLVAPTGNRPTGRFILEPVIGANKCWQLGLTTRGGIKSFSYLDIVNIGVFYDAVLTHLFKSKQTRLFNLKNNGPLSQLLLLKSFNCIDSDVIGAQRVGNILCGETHIGSNFMFDASIMVAIEYCNLSLDIGYNFWIRTREKRSKDVCFRDFSENKYGLKGDLPLSHQTNEFVCPSPLPIKLCEPDLRTASRSTISNSSTPDRTPTLIKISDINFDAPLQPTTYSNKLFGSINYNWELCGYSGFALIGAEREFGHGKSAIDQWGIIFNFGVNI